MEFKLPELGEGVHEGELIKWKVKEGDTVKDDQPLCEIMTDKATVEIPSPFSGKVTAINIKEGAVVHVGQTMITYEGSGGSAKATASTAAAASAPPPVSALASAPMNVATKVTSAPMSMSAGGAIETSPDRRVLAAPATRKFAREVGVDLSRVPATGPHGRVMREDIQRAMNGGSASVSASVAHSSVGAGATAGGTPMMAAPAARTFRPGTEERVPFRGLRKKISEKMRQSKDKAAHFTYVEEADATALVALREHAKEIGAAQGIKVTYLPFIMKFMVAALKQYPMLNSQLDEEKGEIVVKHFFNIGLSVQTEDGLTAPVIKNVEQKSVLEIAREIQNVVDRARAKKLTMEDLTGGTITLTNAGSIGGLFATPVINFPEVAILGFNKIFRTPVAVKVGGREEIQIRDWTYFSISLDHRIVDGAVAAEFMKLFIKYVENPSLLMLEQG